MGAHSPHPLPGGLRPLGPPICPPPLAEGLLAYWAPLVAGLLRWATRPLFWFCGGTSPKPPAMGALPPWAPLSHPVGRGFANVLGPTHGGVANGGDSSPLLVLWGDTSHTPCHGGFAPLNPRLPALVGWGLLAFWVNLTPGQPCQIFPLPSQGRGSGG